MEKREGRTDDGVVMLLRGTWKIPFQYEPKVRCRPFALMMFGSTEIQHCQYQAIYSSTGASEWFVQNKSRGTPKNRNDILALYTAPVLDVITAPWSVQDPGSRVVLVAAPTAEFWLPRDETE